jgi:hypothetical protein
MDRKDFYEQQYLFSLTVLDRALDKFPRLKYAVVHHVNIRGEQMRFDDKPYLVEIYKDTAPEIVLQSSVQTGKSEFLIVSAHSWAERGLQVLYVLPTIELRNLFVANRVDKLYENTTHYKMQLVKSTGTSNSRGLKHFGSMGGAIFFAGSNSAGTFIEKPIDLVIGDETDRFDQGNYEKADDRMTASPWKMKYEASNPTVDKYGINLRYRQSDQREWFVKCKSCNYWQPLDWFKNVVRQTDDDTWLLIDEDWHMGSDQDIRCFCIRCGAKLDRYDTKGCWVPKHPNIKKTHGYHIHQLLSSYVRMDGMWLKFQLALHDDTKMQVFYNSMLGLPFAGKGSKLTDELLNSCKQPYLMPSRAENCFMGVDVGKVLHVVVRQLVPGGRMRLVYAGTVRDFEDLDYLFARFDILGYVIDAMPETRKATEYAKKHTGRGAICRYHNGLDEMREGQTEDGCKVLTVDRTQIMDRVMKWFLEKRHIIPQNAQSLDRGDYYDMLKTPTRILDDEKKVYNWMGDPDHYYHAEVYCLLAYLARGDMSVIAVNPNEPMQKKVPNKFEDAIQFPPGTPQDIIDHYRRIYEATKASRKIEEE